MLFLNQTYTSLTVENNGKAKIWSGQQDQRIKSCQKFDFVVHLLIIISKVDSNLIFIPQGFDVWLISAAQADDK